jgi:hypothetical protein
MSRFIFPYKEMNTMWRKLLLAFLLVLFLPSLGHTTTEKRYIIPIDNCPILGPADAQITIIEFLDFQ